MNQSAGCPEGDMGVPVKGMGVAPHLPSPKCGSLPILRWFHSCFCRNITNPPAPPNPYQITSSLMMPLINLYCILSSVLMSHIDHVQLSNHFIVIIQLTSWITYCGSFHVTGDDVYRRTSISVYLIGLIKKTTPRSFVSLLQVRVYENRIYWIDSMHSRKLNVFWEPLENLQNAIRWTLTRQFKNTSLTLM